jgi:hypothetical protein
VNRSTRGSFSWVFSRCTTVVLRRRRILKSRVRKKNNSIWLTAINKSSAVEMVTADGVATAAVGLVVVGLDIDVGAVKVGVDIEVGPRPCLKIGKCKGTSHPCGSCVWVFTGAGAGRHSHTHQL